MKISPQSPKPEFGLQNQCGRVIHPSIGNYIWSKKKYTFGGQQGENNPQTLKTEFGLQNQCVRAQGVKHCVFLYGKCKTHVFSHTKTQCFDCLVVGYRKNILLGVKKGK
jgi:hypothetical protein